MLDQAKNIFIVGIKGVAMANLAVILKKMGKNITGSDVEEDFITDDLLIKNGIKWTVGFDIINLPAQTDLLIYSAAHQGSSNPQAMEAKKKGINIISQAEFLGELMSQFKTKIAVTGTHGKTTTSSLLAYALLKLDTKPTYMVGSSSFNEYPGGDYNGNKYFVIEADEYAVNPPIDKTIKFHHLKPDYILCTNIDFDHPDVYRDLKHTQEEFIKFFNSKKLILCADDPPTLQSIKRLDRNQYLMYGYSEKADLRIFDFKTSEKGSSFSLRLKRHSGSLAPRSSKSEVGSGIVVDDDSGVPRRNVGIPRMTIKLYGEKNVLNAAGVILTLLQLGFNPDEIKIAIKNFKGAKRRFEQVFFRNGIYLFDDYAHHPREIEATIQAAKKRFPKKRIIIIFQPHTYSRTHALVNEFAKSLSLADSAYILPIFPSARENASEFNVSSNDIARLNSSKIVNVTSKLDLVSHLKSNITSLDVIFTMGAGDVYKLKDDIIEIISKI